jgi:hypothetical protein
MEDKKIKKEELFDDCPICRAMKAVQEQGRELRTEELKEAFKKAKEKGAMVGGEWFDGFDRLASPSVLIKKNYEIPRGITI